LTLGRISNLPTIWTNCIAAWLLNRMGREIPVFELPPAGKSLPSLAWSEWGWILLGASLLYVAGTTLNDAFDEEFDREHNPERPIPSGALKGWETWAIGIVQMLTGAAILLIQSGVNWLFLVMLCGTILAYNAVHKKWGGSVFLMGGCRLFLWWTVATAGMGFDHSLSPLVVVWSVGLLVYIAGITFVARGEATGSLPALPWPYLLLFAPAFLGLFFCLYGTRFLALPLAAILAIGIFHGLRTAKGGGPGIGRGVAFWLALITVGDALAVALVSPAWGWALLFAFPLCLMIQKKYAAT